MRSFLVILKLRSYSEICFEDCPLHLQFGWYKVPNGIESSYCIFDGFKHAWLVEFEITLAIEGLDQPLNLLVHVVFFMDAWSVRFDCKVGESDQIGFNLGQDKIVEEGLTDWVSFILQIKYYHLLLVINCQELSFSHEVYNWNEIVLVPHGIPNNELLLQDLL
jgi:hypothetical protein